MNKTYLLGGLVVVGAVVAFVLTRPSDAPAPAPVADTPKQEKTMAEDVASGSMKMRHTLRELMSMGMGLKCTFTTPDTSGTTYVNGSNIRTDATMATNGVAKQFTTLITDDTMYYWSPEDGEGMKMSMSSVEGPASTGAPAGSNADLDMAYDYDCSQWTLDMSMFVAPADISFRDYDEMMKGMKGMMQGMGTDAGMMEGMEAY